MVLAPLFNRPISINSTEYMGLAPLFYRPISIWGVTWSTLCWLFSLPRTSCEANGEILYCRHDPDGGEHDECVLQCHHSMASKLYILYAAMWNIWWSMSRKQASAEISD